MSEFITQTARLVPYAKRPKQASGFVTAYLYEPLPNEPGSELGSLYIVIEILVSGRASEELADLIIETAGNHYYNRSQAGDDLEARFEAAVKAVNTELGEHVNRGNAAWIGKLSAVIALHSDHDLHLSHTGSAEAFLYRGKTASRITAPSDKRPANPTKTFSSIASGRLEAGDRLLLATPAMTHQISLPRLQAVIAESSPNSAIAEITQLLRHSATDRIACLVIEITTPELAALKVRSEAPSEIHLGAPETPIAAAKIVAAPLAHTTAESGKKVLSSLNKSLVRLRRRIRSLSLALADQIRQLLASRRGRRTAAIFAGFLVLLIAGLIWHARTSGHSTAIFNQYQAAYADYTHAQSQLSAGDSSGAQATANQAQAKYTSLKSNTATIDRQLSAQTKLPAGEPRSYNAFGLQLAAFLQQASGYTTVSPATVASLPSTAKPSFFELSGGRAYVFDTSAGQIYVVNVSSGAFTTSHTDLKPLGVVKGTTLAPAGNGIYILTDTPAVWFYAFQTDSVSKQSIAYDHWPPATAISAYLSNLYLLAGGKVFKYVKNPTGWSPGVAYLKSNDPSSTNPSALAVDGSIYLIVSDDLQRYISGAKSGSAAIPGGAGPLANLNSSPDNSLVMGVSQKTSRIIVWSNSAGRLSLNRDIQLRNTKNLYDAAYDPSTSGIFATADHRLVRVNFSP